MAVHRFWALSKYYFEDTVGETAWYAFLNHLILCKDKLAAVQMNIRQAWDPMYHYCLDLTNTVPIWAKSPHLKPKENAWLDIHLDELVAKRVIGPILSGE